MRLPRKRRRPELAVGSLAFAASSLALAACLAGGGGRPQSDASPGTPIATAANDRAFQALAAALAAGNDAQAGALAARLRQGSLTEAERGLVESAERVLTGRTLVRGLELRLVSEPDPSREGRYTLVLEARSSASASLRLRLAAAELKHHTASINALGVEGLDLESKASRALEDLRLPPGATTRTVLKEYDLALGRALAVRERWRLEPRAGEIECGGVRYPAQNVRIAGCERERLSPLLASGPKTAADLSGALEAERRSGARALLELALRLPKEEREAALAALVPVVERLAQASPQRVADAEPALRWLTQNRDLGPDAQGWSRYLAARAARGAQGGDAPANLDLPEAPREAEQQAEQQGKHR